LNSVAQEWLDEAKAKEIRKTFITCHYPVFARSGFGASLPPTILTG
jgi:hypothetical protein